MATKQMRKLFLNNDESLSTGDLVRGLNQIQENIAQSLNPLASKPSNDATILTNLSLTAFIPTSPSVLNKNIVNHTLGRKLLGYNVMLLGNGTTNQNVTIWSDQVNNKSPQLTLWLYCSADCLINLEVY